MSLVKTVEVIATPRLPPGYTMVNGRMRGPTDQTYPPGTGGSLPRKDDVAYDKIAIITIKDTNSGHTQVLKVPSVQLANGSYSTVPGVDPKGIEAQRQEMLRKAMERAEGRPGERFKVGRAEEVTQRDVDAFKAYLEARKNPQEPAPAPEPGMAPSAPKSKEEIEAEALASFKGSPEFNEEAATEAAREAAAPQPANAAAAPAGPGSKVKK